MFNPILYVKHLISLGQGFADKRKKQVSHQYLKLLRKEKTNLKVGSIRTQQIYSEEEGSSRTIRKQQRR